MLFSTYVNINICIKTKKELSRNFNETFKSRGWVQMVSQDNKYIV